MLESFGEQIEQMSHQQKMDYTVRLCREDKEKALSLAQALLSHEQDCYYYGYFALKIAQMLQNRELVKQGLASKSRYLQFQAAKIAPSILLSSDLIHLLVSPQNYSKIKKMVMKQTLQTLDKKIRKRKCSSEEIDSIFRELSNCQQMREQQPVFLGRILIMCSEDTFNKNFDEYAAKNLKQRDFWNLSYIKHQGTVMQYLRNLIQKIQDYKIDQKDIPQYKLPIRMVKKYLQKEFLALVESCKNNNWISYIQSLTYNYLDREYALSHAKDYATLLIQNNNKIELLSVELQIKLIWTYTNNYEKYSQIQKIMRKQKNIRQSKTKNYALIEEQLKQLLVYEKKNYGRHNVFMQIIEGIPFVKRQGVAKMIYDVNYDPSDNIHEQQVALKIYDEDCFEFYKQEAQAQREEDKRIHAYQKIIYYARVFCNEEQALCIMTYLSKVLANQSDDIIQEVFTEFKSWHKKFQSIKLFQVYEQIIQNRLKKRDISQSNMRMFFTQIMAVFRHSVDMGQSPEVLARCKALIDMYFNQAMLSDQFSPVKCVFTLHHLLHIKDIWHSYLEMKIKNSHTDSFQVIMQMTKTSLHSTLLNQEFSELVESIVFQKTYKDMEVNMTRIFRNNVIYQWLLKAPCQETRHLRMTQLISHDPKNILSPQISKFMFYDKQEWLSRFFEQLENNRVLVVQGFPYQISERGVQYGGMSRGRRCRRRVNRGRGHVSRQTGSKVRRLLPTGLKFNSWSPRQLLWLEEFMVKCQDKEYLGKSDLNQDFLHQMCINRISLMPNTSFQKIHSFFEKHSGESAVQEEAMYALNRLENPDLNKNIAFWIQFVGGQSAGVALKMIESKMHLLQESQRTSIFETFLSTSKITTVKTALRLYLKYQSDSLFQIILGKTKIRKLHKDIRIQITLLMVQIVQQPRFSHLHLQAWGVLKDQLTYDYLFPDLVQVKPNQFQVGGGAQQYMDQIVQHCLDHPEQQQRITIYQNLIPWLPYGYEAIANASKARLLDFHRDDSDIRHLFNLTHELLDQDPALLDSYFLETIRLIYQDTGDIFSETHHQRIQRIKQLFSSISSNLFYPSSQLTSRVIEVSDYLIATDPIFVFDSIDFVKKCMDFNYQQHLDTIIEYLFDLVKKHQYYLSLHAFKNISVRTQYYQQQADLKDYLLNKMNQHQCNQSPMDPHKQMVTYAVLSMLKNISNHCQDQPFANQLKHIYENTNDVHIRQLVFEFFQTLIDMKRRAGGGGADRWD